MSVTALISLKVCPNCGCEAPVGWDMEHEDGCSGEYVMSLRRGPWPMEDGDQIVTLFDG